MLQFLRTSADGLCPMAFLFPIFTHRVEQYFCLAHFLADFFLTKIILHLMHSFGEFILV